MSASRRWLTAAAYAAVAGAALAFAVPRLHGRPPPPTWRQPAPPAVESLVPEDHPIPRAAFDLRWPAGSPEAVYTVTAATEDLTVLDRAAGLTAPEHRVPAERLAGLPAGARILWRVESLEPDGSRASSLTFVNTVE